MAAVTGTERDAADERLRQLLGGHTQVPGAAGAGPDPYLPNRVGHETLRGRGILIIDDDPRNAFALTGVPERYGLNVAHAGDGQHGIEMLQAGDCDLVLMDTMMPQLDGPATTEAIRRLPRFAGLPVIAVTAQAMRERWLAVRANG